MTIFKNDSATHPYAQDLDGAWHRRPDNDSWNSGYSTTQCRTVCGQAIHSVRVSEYTPEPDPSLEESLCRACFPTPHSP